MTSTLIDPRRDVALVFESDWHAIESALTRRGFLAGAGGAAFLALAACGTPTAESATDVERKTARELVRNWSALYETMR
ncbi:hypothetical protein ABH922_002502 [Rhodococcus sp. 27YEA15]|uniref:hypothetical protein n=1 Tax=Rhodococcus sp. 27YEA15 TaxID=3156259 RepID=UPI003C7A8626